MKQQEHQETHTKTDETSSNNENNKKRTTVIKEASNKLLSPKASARKRTQCYAPEAESVQHFG